MADSLRADSRAAARSSMIIRSLTRNLPAIDATITAILQAARIPGASVAIVFGSDVVYARGFGHRSLQPREPMSPQTIYPIASTTKAFNSTLIGMLVDEGRLSWDVPVQTYLPGFRLGGPVMSAEATIRDLLIMRTGLPRHDWMWLGNPISRSDIVSRLRYLPLSAGFREKFQYNNLTATAAGHIAELVTGQIWEDLIQERILTPLRMSATTFGRPASGDVTSSYHETRSRHLIGTQSLSGENTAPAGGSMQSTVSDMTNWLTFNLNGGKAADGRQLIEAHTLAEIHAPQVAARTDAACPTPNAAYGIGWFVDTYNGRARIAHGGYFNDVNSSVMLFPQDSVGLVSFINFGPPRVARLLNEHASDVIFGTTPVQAATEKVAEYERSLADNNKRLEALPRVPHAPPSHLLAQYTGAYEHPAYGRIQIGLVDERLIFNRGSLALPLDHWHYDTWRFAESDLFEIHDHHCFDPGSRVQFHTDPDGSISALSTALEPAVCALEFRKLPC
jgi:CubicO group peptidase (beta-lactamase class C family)